MKTNHLTKIYDTGSSGVDVEKRLKFVATIILAICIVMLIVTRGSLSEFLGFLLK